MTRFELEEWCEKFLKNIFENSKHSREFLRKAVQEDMDEDEMMAGILKITSSSKTYTDYKKELANFIVDYAKKLIKED